MSNFLCDCIRIVATLKNTVFFGGNCEEETPVPIPNTEVKLFSADGTAREAEWESRTPPKNLLHEPGIAISKHGDSGFFNFAGRIPVDRHPDWCYIGVKLLRNVFREKHSSGTYLWKLL